MSATKPHYFIGLMSGTSLDGIDAALVDFSGNKPALICSQTSAIPAALKTQILELCTPGGNEIERMGQTDTLFARLCSRIVLQLLERAQIDASLITAIGSHGQTIRHQPASHAPFTLQIGDPNIIAQQTGITTVADFRRRDMAANGQGAPLAPAFHEAVFRSNIADRAILNIGGMANLTLLPASPSETATGFDTGPGNVLIDAWCQQQQQQPFDKNGQWSRSGRINQALLDNMLMDDYFHQTPPKSTGRELFNPAWLEQRLIQLQESVPFTDIATTLTELTARSICQDVERYFSACQEIFVCGGGAHNQYLLERIAALLPHINIYSTLELGIDADWVEATAFAWLAKQTLAHLPGNLPAVTGADSQCILGGVYYA